MAPIHQRAQELRLRCRMEERDSGKAPEACSGRTATTLARPFGDGTNGSATGTVCRGREVR